MCKEQLTKICIHRAEGIHIPHRDRNIFQRKPLQLADPALMCLQRHKGGLRLYNRMPGRTGQCIAVPGGTCRGVGKAAGCKQYLRGVIPLAILRFHAAQALLLHKQLRHAAL